MFTMGFWKFCHSRTTDLTGIMPLKVICPRCGTLHRNIDKSLLGQRFQCSCGKVVRLGARSGSIVPRPAPKPVQRESRPAPAPVANPDQNLPVAPTRVVRTSQRPVPIYEVLDDEVVEVIGEDDVVETDEVIVILEADIVIPIPASPKYPAHEQQIVAPTRIIRPGGQSP